MELDLNVLTVASTRTAMRQRQVTATSLAEAFYKKIAAGSERATLTSQCVRNRAAGAGRRIDCHGGQGEALPPLAGVPVAIKDVMVTAGVAPTAGRRSFRFYSAMTIALRRAARAAGADVLGKVNCDSLQWESSNENSAYGPGAIRDLSRVPADPAAARRHGCCGYWRSRRLLGNTGGSFASRSISCGVVWTHATYGRSPATGLIHSRLRLITSGPLTELSERCRIDTSADAGRDPMDSTSADVPCPITRRKSNSQ